MESLNGHDPESQPKTHEPGMTIETFPVIDFFRYMRLRALELFAQEIGTRGYLIVGAIFLVLMFAVAYFLGDPIHAGVGPD
jgi:hypothetical protein